MKRVCLLFIAALIACSALLTVTHSADAAVTIRGDGGPSILSDRDLPPISTTDGEDEGGDGGDADGIVGWKGHKDGFSGYTTGPQMTRIEWVMMKWMRYFVMIR